LRCATFDEGETLVNVYMYQAALYCEACGEPICERLTKEGNAPPEPDDESSFDSDDFPKGPFPEGESDNPQHCDACGVFLENDLTTEGYASTLAMIEERLIKDGELSGATAEWSSFYGIEPKDPKAIRFGRMSNELRENMADEETGELWKYADGGYPLFYVVGDSEVVCPACANDPETGLQAFGFDQKIDSYGINYEDPDLWCDCGERIPSAYAEDEVEENATVDVNEGKDTPQ
jgi:hypothetical protein